MPDLRDLPDGSRVFVDTNIFDLAYRAASASCVDLIERIARGEITAYVNIQVLSDLLHKLMLTEAQQKKIIANRSASKLKEKLSKDRIIAAKLSDYQRYFEQTLALGLKVMSINEQLLIETKLERATYGLMTGDSLHLGCMNRCKNSRRKAPLYDIVTYDGDFDHIVGVTVWRPQDVAKLQPVGTS